MPAENTRLFWRVGSRDRWFVGIVLGATVALTPVGIVLAERGSHPPKGCVTQITAGPLGGQTGTYCGRRATRFCASEGGKDSSVAAQCRKLGLPVGMGSP